MVIGHWVGEIDNSQVDRVLGGHDPFDEAAFAAVEDHHGGAWDEPAGSADDTAAREDAIDVRTEATSARTR